MGSAILAHCASRGASCVGLEQFDPVHAFGSSHGKSRLIRKAYFEDPAYVPLLRRTYDLWRELEEEAGERDLLRITGLLTVGEAESALVEGTQRAAREHGLLLESLGNAEAKARYPMVRLLPEEVALFEPDGGVVNPERAVRAHLKVAEAKGAETRFGVAMQSWRANADGFEIETAAGERIAAKALVLALGPWFTETLGALGVPIRVQRNVQAWFEPATSAYNAENFPAFLVDRKGLPAPLYGVPDFGEGVKAALHGFGDLTNAEQIERKIDTGRDIEPLVRAMQEWMPGATHALKSASVCMYSLTPDEHFVVDRHPEHPNLVLCGGFSGHGFKFAPVMGEVAAELALEGCSRHDIGFLSLSRFAPQ